MFKVFKMNDYDWVAAENWEQAREWYLRFTGLDEEEINDNTGPQEGYMWLEYTPEVGNYIMENSIETEIKPCYGYVAVKLAFEEVLEIDEKSGKRKEPFLIASTEY